MRPEHRQRPHRTPPFGFRNVEVTPASNRRLCGSTRKPISVACETPNCSTILCALTHRRPSSFSIRFLYRIIGKRQKGKNMLSQK